MNVLLSGAHDEEEITKGTRLKERGGIAGESFRRSAGYLVRGLFRIKEHSRTMKLILRARKVLAPTLSLGKGMMMDGFKAVMYLFLSHEILRASQNLKILEETVREFEPDIIFLQTLLYPCYLALFLPETIPLVITFWNGDLTWWAQWTGIERRLKKHLVAYGVRRAQAVTVNSTSAFNKCVEYGAEEERIRLIRYPGVDLSRFRPQAKSEARKKLQIDFEKVVFSPRGLGDYLNSDIIVEAIPMVIRKCPNTLFLFVSGSDGKEQEWEKHLQRVRHFGVEKNVRWDGKVPWDLMELYYNASDTMVSISSNDSLPNCMLEAMACGTPIVMGDIPSIREWVADGVNGFLVPPRDPVALSEKIMRVLNDPVDSKMSFAKKNLELARRVFDSVHSSQEIKKLLYEIAGNMEKSAQHGTHKNVIDSKG
jgi:glycosyltransferase involved in cell wall biosynthesis